MQVKMIEKARANRVAALYCISTNTAPSGRLASRAKLVLVGSEDSKAGNLPGAFGIFKSHRRWRQEGGALVSPRRIKFPQSVA